MGAFSYVIADIGRADFWLSAVEAFPKLLPNSGAMTIDVSPANSSRFG
jgi:hypothetical protein